MFHLPFVLFMAFSLITHCNSTPTSCKSNEKSLKHKNSGLKCSITGELQRQWGVTHYIIYFFFKYEASDSFSKNMLGKSCTYFSRSKQKGQSNFWSPIATFKIMSIFLHLNCTWYLLGCFLPIQVYVQTWTTSEEAGDSWQKMEFSFSPLIRGWLTKL